MLRNLEKNVIFRAIITKKILHKSKKKKRFRVSLSAQAIVQIFGRFKMVPFPFDEPAILPIQQIYSAVQ